MISSSLGSFQVKSLMQVSDCSWGRPILTFLPFHGKLMLYVLRVILLMEADAQ